MNRSGELEITWSKIGCGLSWCPQEPNAILWIICPLEIFPNKKGNRIIRNRCFMVFFVIP